MDDIVKIVAEYAAYFAEVAAAFVIVIGSIQAIWIFMITLYKNKDDFTGLTKSRLRLGHSLSLGLGFLVGADVVKSAVMPTWESLGQLGAVVVIRVILTYFLMKDIKSLEQ
ncbi:MAG: DUF1622 domain-containing protein [Myxococcota bacterium]|nr:DUF1622 domain-containing protein [Myxococcota bacterium]